MLKFPAQILLYISCFLLRLQFFTKRLENETKDKDARFAQSFIAFGDPSVKGAHQASNSIIIGTNAGKKKGRRKAKGINVGDDEIEVEIYDGKIIIPKATQEITILFHQKLNGAWTTFTEYPNSKLETLYARYRAQRFKQK
ncbi:hypothetical protein CMV_000487 [Castanea mollissima]|uniref:Uncharacterized protein n=1 Tax=Castanea mollissima TaxID=60419 RepID=A0A8J4RM92_9ROSI|nr:hypothetical protein CMV_000487 [Castanea mollissima]